MTHLRDVARVELAASEYGLRSLLDNKPAVAIAINQAPGANSLQISDQVRADDEGTAGRHAGGRRIRDRL